LPAKRYSSTRRSASVEIGGDHVEVAASRAAADSLWIDVHAQENGTAHGRGQGLRSAHSAQPRADHQAPGEVIGPENGAAPPPRNVS